MANHSLAGSPLAPRHLATIILSRIVLHAVFRIAYPLVPFIALQFGISEAQATAIITIQVVLGLASLLGGWLGDRIGYRSTMLLGLGFLLLGTGNIAVASTFIWLLVAYGLCGIGAAIFQPTMQAYVSSLTSYAQRGRAIGLVELSWALSGLLAVPLLMRLVQWQHAISGTFTILAVGTACVIGATALLLPVEQRRPVQPALARLQPSAVLQQPGVWALCAFLFLVMSGNEIVFVAQAPWASEHFGASPADLGTAVFVFGIGELAGSSLALLLIDRWGKRRATLLGFGLSAVTYLLLPLVSTAWANYLVCFALYAVCVEFAIVAAITLSSTVSTVRRATVMALAVVAIQFGRALGSQIGVPLLNAAGLQSNGLIAALLVAGGILIALGWVSEAEQHTPATYEHTGQL